MIGREVYYIEGNGIKASEIIATALREFGKEHDVVLRLRSGVEIFQSRACFSIQELLSQLVEDFERSKDS